MANYAISFEHNEVVIFSELLTKLRVSRHMLRHIDPKLMRDEQP